MQYEEYEEHECEDNEEFWQQQDIEHEYFEFLLMSGVVNDN